MQNKFEIRRSIEKFMMTVKTPQSIQLCKPLTSTPRPNDLYDKAPRRVQTMEGSHGFLKWQTIHCPSFSQITDVHGPSQETAGRRRSGPSIQSVQELRAAHTTTNSNPMESPKSTPTRYEPLSLWNRPGIDRVK